MASGHLNYYGDHTHLVGKTMGPNVFGEYWKVVEAEYFPEMSLTRVGLNILTANELTEAHKRGEVPIR